MLAHDAAADDLHANALHFRRAERDKRVAADEVLARELARKSRHLRRDLVVHLVTVERHRSLETQRVARAEAAGDQPLGLARLQKRFPQVDGVLGLAVDLKAIFTGVARLGDEGADRALAEVQGHVFDEGVVLGGDVLLIAELFENVAGPGALQGDLAPVVALVAVVDVAGEMTLDPGGVLFAVARVDDEPVIVRCAAVDDEVVDDAAIVVAEHRVLDLAVFHVRNVGGDDLLHVGDGVGALEAKLAHVGNVEQTGLFTNGHVLGNHAGGILHGHQEAAEFDDLAAHVHMRLVKWGLLFHSAHPPKTIILMNIIKIIKIKHQKRGTKLPFELCASVDHLRDSPPEPSRQVAPSACVNALFGASSEFGPFA